MSMRLYAIATVALFVGIWAAGGSLAGGPPSQGVSVNFELTQASCPQLTTPGLIVTGSGTARTSLDGNGNAHTNITGTATDNAGGQYVFNYHDNTRVTGTTFPIEVMITDHFNLVGNGGANHVHTFFVLRLLFTSPTDFTILFGRAHGDPEVCDPL